jgi:hypothetical protein
LSPEAQAHLQSEAKRLAAVFQRSSSNVEGRNGYWKRNRKVAVHSCPSIPMNAGRE